MTSTQDPTTRRVPVLTLTPEVRSRVIEVRDVVKDLASIADWLDTLLQDLDSNPSLSNVPVVAAHGILVDAEYLEAEIGDWVEEWLGQLAGRW